MTALEILRKTLYNYEPGRLEKLIENVYRNPSQLAKFALEIARKLLEKYR